MSKKGENIYKRKDGRWEARYISCYNSEGKAKYGYCYAKTYREAKEKALVARERESSGNERSQGAKTRFSCYCDEWLRLNKVRIKESSFVKYTTIVEKHIKAQLGGYPVCALTTSLIGNFTNELLNVNHLSAKTVGDILTVLSSVIKFCARQNSYVDRNIEICRPKTEKKEMRVLNNDEQEKLTAFLLKDTDCMKFGILLSLITGLRIGEICALKWENISFSEATLKIDATMQRIKSEDGQSKTKILISRPKSDTSARIIPLTQTALLLCKRFYADNPKAYVLSASPNTIVEPRTLQNKLKKYTAACQLEGVHFHTLRHTFATRCVEAGFEIKSLSEILGHASVKITLERYVHSSLELKRSNMNKLDFAVGL